MALQQRELFSGLTRGPHIRMAATTARACVFAINAGATLLPVGTPIHFNGTDWVVWTDGATPPGTILDVHGFVYFQGGGANTVTTTPNVDPAVGTVVEGLQLSASEEVQGVVMLKGKIHIDDIPIPAGETLANLKLALLKGAGTTIVTASALMRDLIIEGLEIGA